MKIIRNLEIITLVYNTFFFIVGITVVIVIVIKHIKTP